MATFDAPGRDTPVAAVRDGPGRSHDRLRRAIRRGQGGARDRSRARPRRAVSPGRWPTSGCWRRSPSPGHDSTPSASTTPTTSPRWATRRPSSRWCLLVKVSGSRAAPPGGPIVCPEVVRRLDYEGEMVIVMGSGREIGGFCIADDVSARDLQGREPQWTRAKGADTFRSGFGPWVTTADEVPDPAAMTWPCARGSTTSCARRAPPPTSSSAAPRWWTSSRRRARCAPATSSSPAPRRRGPGSGSAEVSGVRRQGTDCH